MATRELLSSAQRSRLSELPDPMDEWMLARHHTLSVGDLAVIGKRRRADTKLGFATQLCYLRFPGRSLRPGEHPPANLLGYVVSSYKLLKDSVGVLLEGSPPGIDAGEVGWRMAGMEGVREVHDLHVWTITSGFPALASHVLVGVEEDCHARRRGLEAMLAEEYGIEHTTLQVDHAGDHTANGERLLFPARTNEPGGS